VKQTGTDDQKRFILRLVDGERTGISLRFERRFSNLTVRTAEEETEHDVADGRERHRRGKQRRSQISQQRQYDNGDFEKFLHAIM